MDEAEEYYSCLELRPCPFCGCDDIEITRFGTPKVSCIIECSNCGCTLETNEVGVNCGDIWNIRRA